MKYSQYDVTVNIKNAIDSHVTYRVLGNSEMDAELQAMAHYITDRVDSYQGEELYICKIQKLKREVQLIIGSNKWKIIQ